MLSVATRSQIIDDFTLGPNWTVSKGTQADTAVVQLPTKVALDLSLQGISWDTHFDARRNSDNLWLFSLHYVPELYRLGLRDLAFRIANSFHSFSLTSAFQRHRKRTLSSWDHATALRIEAMAALYAHAQEDAAQQDVGAVFELLTSDLRWAFDPRNIRLNNHGLMLATAVLTGSQALAASDEQTALRLQQYGADCIARILSSVFGDDGFCNENSPYYAHFYLRKLRELRAKHGAALKDTGTLALVEGIMKKATTSMRAIVYPDGGIPPLGDSHRTRSPHQSTSGTFLSRRTGFWVHKTDDLYVSLKCGSESATHKHVDDSSITLRYRDADIFLDSGYHSYTSNVDSRVRALKTQGAHSGLFFRELDDCMPAELYRNYRVSTGIDAPREEQVPTAACSYTVDGRNTAYRTVRVPRQEHLVLVDTFHTLDGWTPVQRFIIPGDAQITHAESSILITVPGLTVQMAFDYEVGVDLFTGQEKHPHRGWVSMRARDFEPSYCLEVTPAPQAEGPLHIDVTIHPTEAST